MAYLAACGEDSDGELGPEGKPVAQLIFRTGFEADTVGSPTDAHIDITGVDRSVGPPNDWERDLKGHPKLGGFKVQYQGGEPEHRYARIIDDPTREGNRVLHYWLETPRTPAGDGFKGRIQANIFRNTGLIEMYKRVRLYVHPDVEVLRDLQEAVPWFMIEELWFDPPWANGRHPFRISLHISKGAGVGAPFQFHIHGQEWDFGAERWQPTVWSETFEDYAVPTGEWLTIEPRYRMGDAGSGRIKFAVTPADGVRRPVFEITNWTYRPNAPEPIPLTDWNPLKLYTAGKTVDYIRENGGAAQIYWDDLEIWEGWPEA